jgi:large subunit ribosomal protein L32e
MADKKDLLEIRKKTKSKKPSFKAQNSDKIIRIRNRWVKPRGLHSKMRLNKKFKPQCVRVGYGSPRAVLGFHRSGLEQVSVSNVKDLQGLDKEKHGLFVSGSVGKRKKVELLKLILEKGFTIINIKDVNDYLTNLEEKFSQKKSKKQEISEKKKEKVKEREELAKQKEAESEKKDDEIAKVLTEDEKKKVDDGQKIQDKKEQDKILTKG